MQCFLFDHFSSLVYKKKQFDIFGNLKEEERDMGGQTASTGREYESATVSAIPADMYRFIRTLSRLISSDDWRQAIKKRDESAKKTGISRHIILFRHSHNGDSRIWIGTAGVHVTGFASGTYNPYERKQLVRAIVTCILNDVSQSESQEMKVKNLIGNIQVFIKK